MAPPILEVRGLTKHFPVRSRLLGAVPKLGSKEPLYTIAGQPPNLASLPGGCAFHPRCPEVLDRCPVDEPHDFDVGPGRVSRCWLNGHAHP